MYNIEELIALAADEGASDASDRGTAAQMPH